MLNLLPDSYNGDKDDEDDDLYKVSYKPGTAFGGVLTMSFAFTMLSFGAYKVSSLISQNDKTVTSYNLIRTSDEVFKRNFSMEDYKYSWNTAFTFQGARWIRFDPFDNDYV